MAHDVASVLAERQNAEVLQRRILSQYALGGVSRDEMQTYETLLQSDDTGEFLIMPNHHTDDIGNIHGFRYSTKSVADISVLPMTQHMFHGTTLAECHDTARCMHPQAIRLLADVEESKSTMKQFMSWVCKQQSQTDTATFGCIPINADAVYQAHVQGRDSKKHGGPAYSQEHASQGRDCKQWAYDVPDFIGIYHAYVRARDSDIREHKLFLICAGGCRKACDQYNNMVKDVGGKATVEELLICDESWWLRRACERNRCGLISNLAEHFNLKIPCMLDTNNYDRHATIATPLTDTLTHDIQRLQNGKVAVFNGCCDTTSIQNGMLHAMHASEGVWMFQGANRPTSSMRTNFGSMFGTQAICGTFPVTTFQVPMDKNASTLVRKERNVVSLNNNPNMVWYDLRGVVVDNPVLKQDFVRCDEVYLKHLEKMHWNRNNQVIEFIPIVVASMVPHSLSV
jgi:hypothetical protein